MCKLIRYKGRTSKRSIDKCMIEFIAQLEYMLDSKYKTISSCCGHGKYPMTVIIKNSNEMIFELFTGKEIRRKMRFYRKDKQGYYYILEVQKCLKKQS